MDRLNRGLSALGDYCPLQIDDLLFTRDELDAFESLHERGQLNNPRKKTYDRLQWLKSSAMFRHSIWFYSYSTGGAAGGWLHFIWQIPNRGDTEEAEIITKSQQAITKLKQCKEVPVYLSRAMLKEFKDRYKNIDGCSPSILAEIAAYITGDESAGSHGEVDAQTRKRIKLWLDQSDPKDADQIVVDLRRLNKSPTLYNAYWAAMGAYLDQIEHITHVDDKRHGTTCRAPPDWSIPRLIESVVNYAANNDKLQTLDPEDDVPTEQWVRMSFSPANPWLATSENYTCRFDISYGLVSRNGKSDHPQGAYAARIFKAWRHKVVEWKKKLAPHGLGVKAAFLDDKTSFKIAEPEEVGGEPVAPLERNKKTPVIGGEAASAGQHNFTWAKGNPSMALLADIPDDPDGSFYRGQVCGVIQDQLWRPSSAIRHATQFKEMLDRNGGAENLSLNFIFTDGGPDHNVKHLTVQISPICLHLSTGADATIAARPASHNSWVKKQCGL